MANNHPEYYQKNKIADTREKTHCDGNKENFFTHLNFLVFSSLINATVPAWMAYMKQKANLSPKKKEN